MKLEETIGYNFKDKTLLRKALIHRSFAFERKTHENYEVLEFLGDAVIGLIVSEELIKKFPDKNEGQLSKIRSFLVSEISLSKLARSVGTGKYILLGKGEEATGGRDKDSILCDVFESIFGAIYLDAGFETAKRVFRERFLGNLLNILSQYENFKDFKGSLQEYTQRKFKTLPKYRVISMEGPEHRKTFTVECSVNDVKTVSSAYSKKAAEEKAASEMLKRIEESDR